MILVKLYKVSKPWASLLIKEYYVYLVRMSIELGICEEFRKVSKWKPFLKQQQHLFQNIVELNI